MAWLITQRLQTKIHRNNGWLKYWQLIWHIIAPMKALQCIVSAGRTLEAWTFTFVLRHYVCCPVFVQCTRDVNMMFSVRPMSRCSASDHWTHTGVHRSLDHSWVSGVRGSVTWWGPPLCSIWCTSQSCVCPGSDLGFVVTFDVFRKQSDQSDTTQPNLCFTFTLAPTYKAHSVPLIPGKYFVTQSKHSRHRPRPFLSFLSHKPCVVTYHNDCSCYFRRIWIKIFIKIPRYWNSSGFCDLSFDVYFIYVQDVDPFYDQILTFSYIKPGLGWV